MTATDRAALILALRSAATHGVPMPAAISAAMQEAARLLEVCAGCAYCFRMRQETAGQSNVVRRAGTAPAALGNR